MAAPKWFETTTYFNNKLAQMQRDEPEANWTADSLTAAFEKGSYNVNSADSMYTHFEQYGNTATERVSPNQYFDNDYYMNSKLAQMQATNPGYTMAQLETAMFSEGNMSPWTHYTLYGITEGIDPSAGFNTKEYMAAKLAQMQAEYPDENWTMDSLFEAFRAGNLNPIEHYFEYGVTENLDFTPGGGVTPPAEYNEIQLVAGEHEFTGTAGNDNFIADVASSSSQSTLQKDDVIDGVEGQDILTVDLASNWGGFSSKGGMSNVETVNINNSGSRAHTFNATGIEGAQTYNIDGNVSLSNVAAGVAVNLADVNAATSIGFADGAVDGVNDTLALGLENVIVAATSKSSAQPVDIKIQGIENLDVTASGLENRVDLSGVSEMKALSINGEGKLYVTDVDSKLETINAADATGNVTVNAKAAAEIKSAELGSGNDTLTVKSLSRAAVINGGEGDDELVITGVGKSTYQLQMDGVEGVTVDGNTGGGVVLDGVNTSGLEALTVKNAGADVTLAGYTGSSELTINVLGSGDGKNASKVFVDEIQSVNFNVGDDSNGTRDEFSGELILPDASQLNIQVLEGTAAGAATFEGKIDADQVTDLSIDTASNNSIFTLNSGSALSNVESVTVTGFGDVDLGSEVGGAADNLTVDASRLLADFSGDFRGGEGQTLDVTGSRTGTNGIALKGDWDEITVNGGSGDDWVDITGLGTTVAAEDLHLNLGLGSNRVYCTAAQELLYADAIKEATGADNVSFAKIPGSEAGAGVVLDEDGNYVGPTIPSSNIVIPVSSTASVATIRKDMFADPDQAVQINVNDGQTYVFEQVTSNMVYKAPADGGASTIVYAMDEDSTMKVDATDADRDLNPVLNVTNTGEGTVWLVGDGNLTLDGGLYYETSMIELAELNLNTGTQGGGISIGIDPGMVTSSGANTPKSLINGLKTAILEGDGDVFLGAQLGSNTTSGTHHVKIDASALGGGFDMGDYGLICSNKVDFTGSNAGNHANFQLTTAGGTDGTGDHSVKGGLGVDIFDFNTAQTGGVTTAHISVDLGGKDSGFGDGQADTVRILAQETCGSQASVLTINNFELGKDKIELNSDGGHATYIQAGNAGANSGWDAGSCDNLLKQYGVKDANNEYFTLVDGENFWAKTDAGSNVFYFKDGDVTYAGMVFGGSDVKANNFGNGVESPSLATLNHTALALVEVNITGTPTDFTSAQFGDFTVAS